MAWYVLRPVVVSFILGANLVDAALNLNGTHAYAPATRLEDSSPIADHSTYNPDQHDCPLPCFD